MNNTATKFAEYTRIINNDYGLCTFGDWGIRVVGDTYVGAKVAVNKKGGGKKEEIVTKILWSRKDKVLGKICICAISTIPLSRRWGYSGGRFYCQKCKSNVDEGTICSVVGYSH
jgi:hypothetical protein